MIGGLSVQQFDGNHFGYITYLSNDKLRNLLMSDGDYQYYDSDANKFDGSAFIKALYRLSDSWDAFADMQYRRVNYTTDGYNDKFVYNKQTYLYDKHMLDIDETYNFVALSHREPERNNFTDNGNYPAPKTESLLDYEAGYSFATPTWRAGFTVYYMDYDNQLVQTGAQSDIGEPLTTNVKKSYRAGVELTAGCDITSWMTVEGNASLSLNKIKDFDEFVEDWDDWDYKDDDAGRQAAMALYHIDGNGDELRQFHYDNSTLAFSPSAILNGFLNFHYKGWQAVWHTNFVSRQYLDNSENKDRSLPSYSTTNVKLSYTLPLKKIGVKEAVFGVNLNNIFDAHYASSGWAYSAICESSGHMKPSSVWPISFWNTRLVPGCGSQAF